VVGNPQVAGNPPLQRVTFPMTGSPHFPFSVLMKRFQPAKAKLKPNRKPNPQQTQILHPR